MIIAEYLMLYQFKCCVKLDFFFNTYLHIAKFLRSVKEIIMARKAILGVGIDILNTRLDKYHFTIDLVGIPSKT